MTDFTDICEIKECGKPAKYLTATESKIIHICTDHYNQIYKK